MTNKIFISYNTNSITKEALKPRYEKIFDLTTCADDIDKYFTSYRVTGIDTNKLGILRTNIFEQIKTRIKTKNFDFYIDMIDNSNKNVGNDNERWLVDITKNIADCSAYLFVVDDTEISFWQLQEVFLATFYNKTIIYLSTRTFIKLVSKNKLCRYIANRIKAPICC